MQSFLSVYCDHDDFIHDLSFDWYGNRLATCSSDQKIKVWDHLNGKWSCTAEIKAHSGSVHKLSWAHPEFGQVLASCSSDRSVHIYEELLDARSGIRTWKKQGRLVDSRDSVQDIQFAPRHLGLKLATCSLDGRVRIYESQDVMNLSVWPLVEEFSVSDAARNGAHCLSWNTSPFDAPMLVVASEREVKLWEYSSAARRWNAVASLDGHMDQVHDVCWAPNLGRAYHLIATACKDGCVRVYKLSYNKTTANYSPSLVAKLNHHKAQVWRVSWNVSGTILASTGDDGVSRLWKSDFNGAWHPILVAAATPASQATGSTTVTSPQLTGAATPAVPQSGLLNRFQSAPASSATATAPASSGFSSNTASSSSSAFGSSFLAATPTFGSKPTTSGFGAINESQESSGMGMSSHRAFN